jgi:hypothetical protein
MVWDAEEKGILNRARSSSSRPAGNTGIALAFVAAARGLSDHADDAGDHVDGAAQGAPHFRREAGPDRGPGMKGPSRRRTRSSRPTRTGTCCCSSSRTRPTRSHPREDHGTGDLERHGGADRRAGVRSRHGRHHHGRLALHQASRWASRSSPSPWSRSASPVITQTLKGEPLQPGPHKIQGIGAGSFRTRWICRWWTGWSRDQRGIHRDGAAAGARGGHPVRHLLRGGGGGGDPDGEGAGDGGQDDRGDAARPGERYLSSVLFEGMFNEIPQHPCRARPR